MGRAGPRRPATVREARARWISGWLVLGDHPAQTRCISQSLRRLQPGQDGALRCPAGRQDPQRSRNRAQQAEGEIRSRQRPRLPKDEGRWRVARSVSLAVCRRETEGQRLEDASRSEIGRASCTERAEMSGGAVSLKKKKKKIV